MATQTMPQFRPLLVGEAAKNKRWYQRINFKWLLQRVPMLFFAAVSSYGVGDFLHISGLPAPFYQIGSVSFDIGFLGVIALADMQLTKTLQNKIAYYLLNFTMSGLAALFNVLSHAGGKYHNITPEDITAGVPFALVGLAFALFYESIMSTHIAQEQITKENAEKTLQLTREKCKYCGEGKPSMNAIYGHYRSCKMKTMHDKTPGKDSCKCLLCKD